MHILCPHCRNPIEVVTLTPREELSCPSCGSSFLLEGESTTAERTPNQKLGKFELLGPVGQGAFGTVYKARDPELDRVVAIKVPRAGNLSGPQETDRFLREARSVAQLRHPSIVTVHEAGQADGLPYLVSDFVEGVTLADLLTARRPGFREAAELIASVADALQYAHEHGVVHRDIKPSNIMIGDDDKPCVMDFGLAKRDAGEITMTMEGQVLGTPAYMPPEQARGEGHDVDGRSDVYSLGVILYELLTGELPFRGNKRMLLHQVLHDDPRPPRGMNDRIPRDLETICLRAMAKEPARRYGAAKELADDLRRWLGGEAIKARPVGRLEHVVRWASRRPAAAGLVAVSGVAVLALLGLLVGLLYNGWLQAAYESELQARSEAEAARQAEGEQRQKAEAAFGEADAARKAEQEQREKVEMALGVARAAQKGEEDQRKKAEEAGYVHSVLLADLALRENNVAAARQRLTECKESLRGWEWRYLNAQCHTELTTQAEGEVFSPDWTRGASRDKDGVWHVNDLASRRELFSLKEGEGRAGLEFSPDGTRILLVGDGLRIHDARTGAEILTLKGVKNVSSPFSSPNGTRILCTASDGTVRVHDVRSGKELFTIRDVPAGKFPWFSPDGALFAVSSGGVLRVHDGQTGKEICAIRDVPVGVNTPFSPDGGYVALSGQGVARVHNARTGEQIRTVKQFTPNSYLEFNPDSSRVLVAPQGEKDDTVRVFDLRGCSIRGQAADFRVGWR